MENIIYAMCPSHKEESYFIFYEHWKLPEFLKDKYTKRQMTMYNCARCHSTVSLESILKANDYIIRT